MNIVDNRNINILKHNELVCLKCQRCQKIFKKRAAEVRSVLNKPNNGKNLLKYCSISCGAMGNLNSSKGNIYDKKRKIHIEFNCEFCGKPSKKHWRDFERSNKHFCSKSCNAKYGNKHRLFGKIARSDFEYWIENRLKEDYKYTEFVFNDRKILDGLELDIYIPSLKLAFEINGLGHYKPIYGIESLKIRKKTDRKKRYRSKKQDISLHIICAKKLNKHDREYYIKIYSKIKNKINNFLQSGM